MTKQNFTSRPPEESKFRRESDLIREEFGKMFGDSHGKELSAILDAAADMNSLTGYIEDCPPQTKKSISKEFRKRIDRIEKLYLDLETRDNLPENLRILSNMDLEISHLKESLEDFSANKLRLSEFFEIIFFCNISISEDIENFEVPAKVDEFVRYCLQELRNIELVILRMRNNR